MTIATPNGKGNALGGTAALAANSKELSTAAVTEPRDLKYPRRTLGRCQDTKCPLGKVSMLTRGEAVSAAAADVRQARHYPDNRTLSASVRHVHEVHLPCSLKFIRNTTHRERL